MTDNNESVPEIILGGDAAAQAPLPARLDQVLPDQLLILPMSSRPFFPAQTMPIASNKELWLETIERVGKTPHRLLGLVYARNDDQNMPTPEDFASVGTVVRVHNAAVSEGTVQFIAEGLQRFRIASWTSSTPPLVARVEYPGAVEENSQEVRAYALAIINMIKDLLPLNPLYKENLRAYLDRFSADEASPLTDFAAALTSASADDLQEVLETIPLLRRMEKTLLLIQHELEVAGLQSRIRERVEQSISDTQREFFLKEQLKEIQQQLGIS